MLTEFQKEFRTKFKPLALWCGPHMWDCHANVVWFKHPAYCQCNDDMNTYVFSTISTLISVPSPFSIISFFNHSPTSSGELKMLCQKENLPHFVLDINWIKRWEIALHKTLSHFIQMGRPLLCDILEMLSQV